MSTSWPSLLIHPLSFVSSQGSRCNEPCSEGLWGRHCNQTCFKHCPNSDTCLRETGACVCRPGYWGVTCQNSECWQTAQIWWDQIRNVLDLLLSACPLLDSLFISRLPECRAGMYGDQCSMSCPSCGQSYRCHHVTGECDCLPGHTGANCDQGWHQHQWLYTHVQIIISYIKVSHRWCQSRDKMCRCVFYSLSSWLLRQTVLRGVCELRQQLHMRPPGRPLWMFTWLDRNRLLHTWVQKSYIGSRNVTMTNTRYKFDCGETNIIMIYNDKKHSSYMCLTHGRGTHTLCFQHVLQDVLARSALRPAPVRPTSSVTDLLETVCVKVEATTVNKVQKQSSFPVIIGSNIMTFINLLWSKFELFRFRGFSSVCLRGEKFDFSFHVVSDRLVWAVGERHGSSSSWREGVLGSHRWHRRARHPGGVASGSAAALPSPAEGQAEQHAVCLLLHQPHSQLWVRRSRYDTDDISVTVCSS